MSKKYKPVYVQGTLKGEGVIEALKAYNGINRNGFNGVNDGDIYYIDPENHTINCVSKHSSISRYIIATGEEIAPLRWRAKEDGTYFMISASLFVLETTDTRDSIDNDLYKSGNYFKTKEEAKKVLEKIKPYFKH
jgi:hypothetical protein